MKKLIIVIFLGLTGSACSTATTPRFPDITCTPIQKMSEKQLLELSKCKKDTLVCTLSRQTLLQIHGNYQNKAECLDIYQETAKEFRK